MAKCDQELCPNWGGDGRVCNCALLDHDRDDDDQSCCTLDETHDGPCVWECSECRGSGNCWLCAGDAGEDDVAWCEGCDGIGSCLSCWGRGTEVEDMPSITPRPVTDVPVRDGVL